MEAYAFSRPYLYDSLMFGGDPTFVDCAEQANTTGACAALRVCAVHSTTHMDSLLTLLPPDAIVSAPSLSTLYHSFVQGNGICNVIAGGTFDVAETVVRGKGHTGAYAVGNQHLSKEPLALVTRRNDAVWSDFVNWVMIGLMHADEVEITQVNAANFQATSDLFGPMFTQMFVRAVAAVGSYSEIYARHLERIVPQAGTINTVNNGDLPLIYAFPLGSEDAIGPNPHDNAFIEQIRRRGHLRCGIRRQLGFGDFDPLTQRWSGQDVDFCRAVSAAIFDGSFVDVVFIEATATNRFFLLQNYVVDLLCRTNTYTHERDVYRIAEGTGFSFAPTTYYTGMAFGGIPP